MNSKKIGSFISELRREQGLKQQELAEKLSVTDKAISKWETGKGIPDISIIQNLAATLGVSVEELLNGERMPEAKAENDEQIIKKLKIKKYIRFGAELIITAVFLYTIYVFYDTFRSYASVLDIYLHKNEIQFISICSLVFIAFSVLWILSVIISAIAKKKASITKTIIICLSFSFVLGSAIKMAEYDDAKTVEIYDKPVDIVSYIDYREFFDDDYMTQITIKDTNDIITEHYSAYFDSVQSTGFVYTNCVTTDDTEITDKYFEEEKKIYTMNVNPTELDENFCKGTGITKGYYVTGLYSNSDIAVYFVKDKSCYSINISNSDINDKTLIQQIKAL